MKKEKSELFEEILYFICWAIILIPIFYILFYCREMTKIDEDIQTAQNLLRGMVEKCYKLEEENKTLKEKVETLELWLDNKEKLNEEYRKLIQKIDQLEEENENLRKDLFHLTNNGGR